MRPKEIILARRLDAELCEFSRQEIALPGIKTKVSRDSLVEQMVESIRRIRFVSEIAKRNLSPLRANPSSELFDPLRASILHKQQGQYEEACWLVFLFVHFGKHRRSGWRLVRDVYGGLGEPGSWNWERVSNNPQNFRDWLHKNEASLRGGDGVSRHFGNHRKYESLKAQSPNGTGEVVETYIRWIKTFGAHEIAFRNAESKGGFHPRKAFDHLYQSMNAVARFGRTARFDYLTMIGKLGLATIEPGSTYMKGATGPIEGARLLFGGSKSAAISVADLDTRLIRLEAALSVGAQGMQILEDALCNWQKSPSSFKPFRG